jgi:hypothetical protein
MRKLWDDNKDWIGFAAVFYIPIGIIAAIGIIWNT